MKKGRMCTICATSMPVSSPAAIPASPPGAGGFTIAHSITGSVFYDTTGVTAPLTNGNKIGHMAIK